MAIMDEVWVVVDSNERAPDGSYPEDLSIYTVSGREVIGCSEWMRAERATFEYIVALHNARVGAQREEHHG